MTSILVFAGKGGVGKTTYSAATALHHALPGKPTLAISTDATPSLAHIFEAPPRGRVAQVRESLFIHELGIREIKQMWDRKFGREVYEVFSSFVDVEYEEFVEFMTSLLPGLDDEFMVDFLATKASEQKPYLDFIRSRYSDFEIIEVPLFPREPRGLERLKLVEKMLFPG